MLAKKYRLYLTSFFMALFMSCFMSLVISLFNVGLVEGILMIWLKALACTPYSFYVTHYDIG